MSPAVEVIAPVWVAEVTNIEALLTPIPGVNPAGRSTQYSGLHDEIREARREDDDLPQGDYKREMKAADWTQVVRLATTALTTETKDLQICAWLAEALVKLYGFTGLRDGLKIMRELHEQFWENAYPEIDEDDLEARANSLAWLDRQLAKAVKEVSLTESNIGANYSYLQWNVSKEFDIPENSNGLSSDALDRIEDMKKRAEQEGKITGEDWRKAKNTTSRAFYEETFRLLNECWNEFHALDHVVDEKFGPRTPGLGALKKSLDDVRSLVEKLVKEKRVLEPDPVDPAQAEKTTTTDGEPQQAQYPQHSSKLGATGSIKTRQDAFNRLAEVAEYFRQTEPHSPVSYLVERAIKWGQLPLEAWLAEVIKESSTLEQVRETLGVKSPTNGDSAD